MDEYFSGFLNLTFISYGEALFRVVCAMLFGFTIGWDRDSKNKPIDFRAYMIVCLTTCIVAMLSQELYATLAEDKDFMVFDLGKIFAGVLTGIGFLGAGAIIKRDDEKVIGTATGASIWACGGIGLCLGFGGYALALMAFLSVACILVIGGKFMAPLQGRSDKEDLDTKAEL